MKTPLKIFTLLLAGALISANPIKKKHEVGDKATSFSLKNVDGKIISLKDYKEEKGVILVFTCNGCPYSKMYEKRIVDLQNRYGNKGYPLVAINPNDSQKSPEDSFEKMVKLAKKKNYPFPYLQDVDQSITKAYGATNTPQVYLLKNHENEFYVSYIGAIDNNTRNARKATKKYVESAIESLDSGKEVKVKKTKAIGCTIKWRDA